MEAIRNVQRRLNLVMLPAPLQTLRTLGNLRLSALVKVIELAERLENRAHGEPFQKDLDFVQTRKIMVPNLRPERHLKTVGVLISVYKYLFERWSEAVKRNAYAVPVHFWVLGALFDYHIIIMEETPEVLTTPLREFLAKWTRDVIAEIPRLKVVPPRGKRWMSHVTGAVNALV